jgi:hypothetical protein
MIERPQHVFLTSRRKKVSVLSHYHYSPGRRRRRRSWGGRVSDRRGGVKGVCLRDGGGVF